MHASTIHAAVNLFSPRVWGYVGPNKDFGTAALREYRMRGSQHQAAEAYRWMAAAHRGLGADDLAAADEAAAGLHETRLTPR